jgi:hypothetical protein
LQDKELGPQQLELIHLLTFQENAGNPFVVGDYVTIENTSAAGFNTSHNQVIAASDNSILINFNSASITGIGITNSTVARSVKISSIAPELQQIFTFLKFKL